MKQKDIALILIIVFISAIVSVFASKAIFSSGTAKSQQAEVVAPITADFPKPDPNYFNSKSIDPTKTITIQQNTNTDPFNGTANAQN